MSIGRIGGPGEYERPEFQEAAAATGPAAASGPAASGPSYPFAEFAPQSIRHFRDGGTITTEGPLNRYAHGTVRLDGRISSETRGQVFVTIRERSSPPQAERPATKDELKELAAALEKFIRERGNAADRAYTVLLDGVKKSLQ